MKRTVCFIVLMMFLFVAAGCAPSADVSDAETTPSDTTPSPTAIPLYQNGATSFRIVTPSKISDEEYDAMVTVTEALAAKGIAIDHARDNENETEFEILIGETCRSQSAELVATLRDRDYVITAKDTKLVIVGGSPNATLAAAMQFAEQYIVGRSDSVLLDGYLYTAFTDTYDVAAFSLNGTPIMHFTIVRPAAASKLEIYAAELLRDVISERIGATLDVTSDKNASEFEIRIGATARSGEPCPEYTRATYSDGNSIVINGDKHSIIKAVEDFIKDIPSQSDTPVDIRVAGERALISTAETAYPAEPSLDGKSLVALCDQKNASVALIDLDAPDPTAPEAVVWEWKPTFELGFKNAGSAYGNRIDEAVIRYSEPLETYVLCVTSSSGYIGIAEYPSGKCVWETTASGLGPHAIEYLPDGNVAVACSGNSSSDNGCIKLYRVTPGKAANSVKTYKLSGAHGVIWDDDSKLLWALGSSELRAYRLGGTEKSPELIRAEGLGTTAVSGGHNLSAVSSDPDRLWISGTKIWQYCKSTGQLSTAFNGTEQITVSSTKSIDSYEDGTVIVAAATGVYANHNTDTLRVVRFEDGKAELKLYTFEGRAFYKARRVDPQYS